MTTPMCLGPFAFESLSFGFYGVSRELATPWAEIKTVGGLDRVQWLGGDSDRVTIVGVVFPEEFGGLDSLEGVRSAARAGTVLPLVTLGGNVYGLYVVEGVHEDQSYHDASGRPRRDVYSIELRRYIGSGFSPISIIQSLFG